MIVATIGGFFVVSDILFTGGNLAVGGALGGLGLFLALVAVLAVSSQSVFESQIDMRFPAYTILFVEMVSEFVICG